METKTSAILATEKTARERGLRVVAIGGGTGLSTLLKGLKRFVLAPAEIPFAQPDAPVVRDLCAIVTVSDDGGSSGRLRKELNMLPPGDIRNCIVALSEDEALLSKLFRHRFDKGSGLEGQLRQSVSRRAHFHHVGFFGSRSPVLGNSADPR